MAPELRHPPRDMGDPILDQIVVAADSEVAVSSDDVYSPRRQAVNYPEFSGHPTPAKGPNLAFAVGDTASRSAPEPVADEPGKPMELSTRQRGHSKPRSNLQAADGSFDVSGKGKARVTPASEEQPSRKKANTSQRAYCAQCQERKSRPAVTGTRRNGNAKHKCADCALLRNKVPEQAERTLGQREAGWSAQPERQDVSTAGKERPRPPKQNNGPPIKPIPGKQELVALPAKEYQKQDDGSEFDTEPDDPDNRLLPHGKNPNVERFGTATGFVNTNHQGLLQQDQSPEHTAPVHKADFYDDNDQPVFFNSARASAQHDGPSYSEQGVSSSSSAIGTLNPALLNSSNFPNIAGVDLYPEPRSPPGRFDQEMEALEHSRDVEASMASRTKYDDRGEVDASLFMGNTDLSNLSYVANQASAHPSASPYNARQQPLAIDPALLGPWGQVHARHPGLKPTSTDPMLTGEERVPANPLPASTSGNNNYDYANPDWTPEQARAEFNAHTHMYDSA